MHCILSIRVRNWCAPWPNAVPYGHAQHVNQFSQFSNVHFVYPQHERKELMRALSMHVRNWCLCWVYASGTNACTERTLKFVKLPSKHAEHTRQELIARKGTYVRTRNHSTLPKKWRCRTVSLYYIRRIFVPESAGEWCSVETQLSIFRNTRRAF